MTRPKFAAVCVAASLALAVSGCGGGSSNSTLNKGASTPSTTGAAGTASGASETPLTASGPPPSVATLQRDLDRLYRAHPDLASYVVQNTAYTTHSRDVVLHSCTSGGSAPTSQEIESARLIACSPLIFYYYSYGTQRNSPDATHVADELFSFAAEDVRGPLSAPTELETLLHAWGITVNTGSVPATRSLLTPKESTLLANVERSILSNGSVRVTISGYEQKGRALVEQIVVDMSKDTSHETISESAAHAQIAVTPTSVLLSGDLSGLTKLIGLPAKAARKAGSHWIKVQKGSSEYTDLATENTIAALPSTILPDGSNPVTLSGTRDDRQPVDVLTWNASANGSTGTLSERLEVSRSANAVPISETTSAGTYLQTVSFSDWGEHVIAPAPPSSDLVSYTSITSK